MAMSSNSTSGWSASVRLMAESPSLAVPTSCAPSALASNSCSRSAASGSSSAISTRRTSVSGIHFHRHCERNPVPARAHRSETAARVAAEARLKPLTDVGEAKAGAFMRGRRQFILAAVLGLVADFDDHAMIVEVPGTDADHHRPAALGHAIFDGVLDDRLQDQGWEAGLFELLRNVVFDGEAIGEARF